MKTSQDILNYLSLAKGNSLLAQSLRSVKESDAIKVVPAIKDMINDNTPMMLEILGEESVNFFKNYHS